MFRLKRILFNIGIVIFIYLLFTNENEECEPSPNYPKVQYSIVVDCGSTGSRIHIYKFNYCKDTPKLKGEVFVHKTPGLSSYVDPVDAAESLSELLTVALNSVPQEMYICTQITIKATAGLRMLSGDLSNQIISEIRKKLEQYPFPIFEDHGVGIMSGKLEGLFAWITTNYLLGKIGTDNKLDTAGVLDLGGGSTQIVFEPKAEMPPGAHTIKIKFAKHSYTLYQHSYDGYGLIQGRERIKKVSFETNKANCLSPTKQIEFKHQEEAVILKGTSSGLKECQTLIQTELFSKDSCPLQPCAFDGVFMPKISETFITQDIFAFSYFYDKYAEPFLKDEFTLDHLQDAAEQVCSKEEPKLDPKGQKEFGKNNQWCADLSFMYTLLSSGYEIPKDRIIKTVKKINGIEIGWTLGAALQMINSQLTDPSFIHCR